MQEKFYYRRSIAVKMLLMFTNGFVSLLPKLLINILDGLYIGYLLSQYEFGMHLTDKYFFVIGAVEDRDMSPFRQVERCAPKKVMCKFGKRRLLETCDMNTLRIQSRHHMLNGRVFSGAVHRLKNDEDRMPPIGILLFLILAVLLNIFLQVFFCFLDIREIICITRIKVSKLKTVTA